MINQINYWAPPPSGALIIEGGSGTGQNIIDFKKAWPDSRIIAIEPDPEKFRSLENNCALFSDVELVQKALWIDHAVLRFEIDQYGVRIPRKAIDSATSITVQSTRLWDYLETKVDLLSLNIGGAEIDVLLDCADRLKNVERIFVQYHSFVDQPQRIGDLLALLAGSGFRYSVTAVEPSPQPFMHVNVRRDIDMRLDILAIRL